MAIADSLISHYNMNQSTGLPTDSTGSHNISSSAGSVAYTASGKIDGGWAGFTATNGQYLKCNDSIILGQSITLNIWAYWSSINALYMYGMITSTAAGTADCNYGMVVFDSKLYYYKNATRYGPLSDTLSVSTWYMLTVVHNSDNTVTGYVNGSVGSTVAGPTVGTTASRPLWIGALSNYGYAHYGTLDEVGIWDRVLTAAEITALYNSGNGLTYPFATGWSKKFNGVTAPAKIFGIAKASISKVNGV